MKSRCRRAIGSSAASRWLFAITEALGRRRAEGNGSRVAHLTMAFKPTESVARKRRTLNGAKLLPDVIAGVRFVDGMRPEKNAA